MSDNCVALNKIYLRCSNKFGFESAFARVRTEDLAQIFYMVEQHSSMYVQNYKEYIDFLDDNGFEVEKNKDDWYILKYLYSDT